MKCMSCNAEVPPAWVHAINSNVCPGCGGSIMDNESQMILAEVRDAMNQMPNNPEGLAGWLLSNYKLVKVGDSEPTEFHQRVREKELVTYEMAKPGPKPVATSAAPATEDGTKLFQKFLQRTGVKMPDAAAMKKAAGTVAPMDLGDEEDEIEDDLGLDDE